jgi:TRAP transporter TAXI family solute receptor
MAAAAAAALLGFAVPVQAQGRLVFATQEAGTMYYTVGSGMAKLLSEKLGKRVAVQPYTGSSVYLPLIDNGEAHLGLSSNLDLDAAYKGADRAPLKNLRAVARLWPLRVALMVRADSGIKTAADLRGKRVTVDLKGQRAMGMVIRGMLATAGLKEGDVKAVTVANVGEGAKMLTEGNVDATFTAIGIPIVKQAHSTISGGVAYVDLGSGDISEKTIGQFAPGVYADKVAPVAAMPEITAPVTVAAFDVFLVTNAAMSDADVGALLKVLEDNFAELQQDFAALRTGDAAKFSAPTNTAPYQPGAIAYYRAKGRWTDANEARDKALR